MDELTGRGRRDDDLVRDVGGGRNLTVVSHDAVMARAAALFRVLVGMLSLAQLAIWWSWSWSHPWTLAGPLASAGWAMIVPVVIIRRGLDPRLSTLELALAGPLACCGGLLIPPSTVGDASNWVFVTVGGITVTAAWCLPVRTAVPAVGAVAAAYWAGAVLLGPSGPAPGVPVRSVVLLVVVTALWAVAVRTCRGRALDADSRLAASVRRYRVAVIARSRAQDRREQERVIHDTVVNTLTGIAMIGTTHGDPGDPAPAVAVSAADIRQRCAGDLATLEAFLRREPSPQDSSAGPRPPASSGPPASSRSSEQTLFAGDSDRLMRAGYANGVTLGVAVFAVCWQAVMVLPVMTMADRYRWPVVAVAVWVALTVVTAAVTPVMVRRRLRRWECVGLLSAAVLAELFVGLDCRGYNVVGFANWALLVATWPLMVIAVNRSAREAFLGAVAMTMVATALTTHEAGAVPLALARLTATVWGLWVGPLAVAVIDRALAAASATTARAVATNAELSTLEISAEAVRADRSRRWEMLATRILPLLRAIADGLLDPSDDAVRRRCAAGAAALRRMLGGSTAADLELVIDSAEHRGVRVETQVSGDLRQVPAGACAAIAHLVEDSLAPVTAGPVLLTVLGGADEAHVFVSFPTPPGGTRGSGSAVTTPTQDVDGQLDVVTDREDGRSSLQLRWRRSPDRVPHAPGYPTPGYGAATPDMPTEGEA